MDRARALELAEEIDADVADRMRFVMELDRLKAVLRQSRLIDSSRQENSAEHSWHLAMTALAMAPLAAEAVDLDRVIRILLVHDIVEIDAGDVFIYDEAARAAKQVEEQAAADRIFALAPEPFATELRELWDEYESRDTPEARFAYSCDRLQPLLLNLAGGGGSWVAHGITVDRVRAINGPIETGMPAVWKVADALLDASVADGTLAPPPIPDE